MGELEREVEPPGLPAVRGQPVGVLQRLPQRGHGLLVGVAPRRFLGDPREPLDGAVRDLGLRVVVRQAVGHGVEPVRGERLERPGGGGVQGEAAGRREALAGHLAGERVREDVHRPVGAGAVEEELEPHQVAERGLEIRGIAPHRLEEAHRRLAPEHGRRLQAPPRRVGEPVDPGQQHLLDRLRYRLGVRRRAVRLDRPRQLLEEERVALGLLDDPVQRLVGERGGGERRAEERRALVGGERRERDLGRVGLREPRGPVAGPVRQHEQDRRAGEAVHQRLHVRLRCPVDPVQVFDRHDQRPAAAAVEAHLAQDQEHPGLDGLGAQLGERLGALGHAEEVEQVRRRQEGVQSRGADAGPDLGDDRLRRVALRDPAALAQHLDDGRVGRGRRVGGAVALEVGDRFAGQALAQLEEQAGLADARFAAHADDLAVAAARGRQAVAQERQLVPAPDEGREAPSAARALQAGQLVRRGRRLRGVAHARQLEAPGEERRGRRPDPDGPRLGVAREGVEHRPHPVSGLGVDLDRARALGDRHRLGVQREAHRGTLGVRPAGSLGDALDGHGGVGRAARGVLEGVEPEDRHDTPGAQLLGAAAEALGFLDDHLQRPRGLGARLRRLRRAGERRAEEGEPAPLPAKRGGRGRRRGGRLGREGTPRPAPGAARAAPPRDGAGAWRSGSAACCAGCRGGSRRARCSTRSRGGPRRARPARVPCGSPDPRRRPAPPPRPAAAPRSCPRGRASRRSRGSLRPGALPAPSCWPARGRCPATRARRGPPGRRAPGLSAPARSPRRRAPGSARRAGPRPGRARAAAAARP